MRATIFLCLLGLVGLLGSFQTAEGAGLKLRFYKKTCPRAEQIIRDVVWKNVAAKSALPAKLVRMFFHDCFVRVQTLEEPPTQSL